MNRLQLRVRFQSTAFARSAEYRTIWVIGDPATGRSLRIPKQLTAGAVHEFSVPTGVLGTEGKLHVECENRGDATLLFRLEDGMEVLVPVGGFGANLLRAALLVLASLVALMAAGLAASCSFGFPTAALATAALLVVMGSGALFGEISTDGTLFGGTEEGAPIAAHGLDRWGVRVFRGVGWVVSSLAGFDPLSEVSAGRWVSWRDVGEAMVKLPVVAGGAFAWIGTLALARRAVGAIPSGREGA